MPSRLRIEKGADWPSVDLKVVETLVLLSEPSLLSDDYAFGRAKQMGLDYYDITGFCRKTVCVGDEKYICLEVMTINYYSQHGR